jgi:hypothetical protein
MGCMQLNDIEAGIHSSESGISRSFTNTMQAGNHYLLHA